ncbi:MAG: hypothetical protein J7M30_16635 [Deltaproteobacteria bacterium]|nr:hypothetical protein [Deltaproteobacteria bacterium]
MLRIKTLNERLIHRNNQRKVNFSYCPSRNEFFKKWKLAIDVQRRRQSLKNAVKIWLREKSGKIVSPPFPDICCHCMNPATERMKTDFDGVKLEIPYCNRHIESAKEYYNDVVRGKTRKITRKISIVLGLLAGFWIVFWVLPESDLVKGTDSFASIFSDFLPISDEQGFRFDFKGLSLSVKLVIGAVLSVVMLKTIVPLLDRYVLHKGAYKLGYWINRRITLVAPGIIDVKVDKKSDQVEGVGCIITFLREQYADLFKAEQQKAGNIVGKVE